jgi:cathepsin D
MAVDEDGMDYSYFSSVGFGPNNKQMYMLIDTGSADTWVMSSTCTSAPCLVHHTLGTADSSTLKLSNTTWTISYGTGTVSGVMANDSMSLAGFQIPMSFGLATNVSNDFLDYPIDGILGLGQPKSSNQLVPTVLQTLVSKNLIKSNMFGIHIQRSSDKVNNGEVNFGGYDSSMFVGNLSWTTSVSTSGLWEIPLDDSGVGSISTGLTGKTAIVDTGTSMILIPPGDAAVILNLFPGVQTSGENFLLPCSTTTSIYLTFSGIRYLISSKDYIGTAATGNMCNLNIIARQAFNTNQWLIGDTFLKNVYTVFDNDNNRVGFGTLTEPIIAGTPTPATSASASASPFPPNSGTPSASVTNADSPSASTSSGSSDTSGALLGDSSPSGAGGRTTVDVKLTLMVVLFSTCLILLSGMSSMAI